MRRTTMVGLGRAGLFTGVALAISCSGSSRSFSDPSEAQAGNGGAEDGTSVAGNSGTGTAGSASQGGKPDSIAGASPVGEAGADAGGAPAVAPTAECPAGYSAWLTSSFSFPNGEIIGTADFPSMPWARSGSLQIDTGRLSGTGAAIVSQGASFPYAGSRVRFRARFTDSNQEVTAAFDAAKDGSGGVRVELDGVGRLSLTEGTAVVAETDLAPLETGVDWFVEATFKGTAATITLSRNNYASEKKAEIQAILEATALKVTAVGTKTALLLASNGGIAPAVDELEFARCGVAPPEYTPHLVDTFERADSTAVGKAEFPTTSTWKTSGSTVRIVGGALESKSLGNATIPLKVPTIGLRVRTTVSMKADSSPYLWADVNYNSPASTHGISYPGYWVWGGPKDGYVYTGIFQGDHGETKHLTTISVGVSYFAELNRDDDIAVLTVRTQSFTGPILSIESNTGLSAKPDPGAFFTVGDEGGGGTLFEDIRLDSYQVQ